MSPARSDLELNSYLPTETIPVFAALGDETRLRLITELSTEGPLSITQLTAGNRITRQAVTKHLHVLAQAGIAWSFQLGRERIWQLEPRPLLSARDYLNQISMEWDEVLGRLKQFVEQQQPPLS